MTDGRKDTEIHARMARGGLETILVVYPEGGRRKGRSAPPARKIDGIPGKVLKMKEETYYGPYLPVEFWKGVYWLGIPYEKMLYMWLHPDAKPFCGAIIPE